MIYFIVPAARENMFREYLAMWGRGVAERVRIQHYETLLQRTLLERGTYVLSTLDQLAPAMESALEDLHRRISGTEGFRFLNHPLRTLRRYELLTELARLKWNDFRAVHAAADLAGLRYPVF